MSSFYAVNYGTPGQVDSDSVERAILALQKLHAANVHDEMKVDWGTYRSLNGHAAPGQGCLRCHNGDLVDAAGEAIAHDCTTCHSILADDSRSPFAMTRLLGELAPERSEHAYLRQDYRRTMGVPEPDPDGQVESGRSGAEPEPPAGEVAEPTPGD